VLKSLAFALFDMKRCLAVLLSVMSLAVMAQPDYTGYVNPLIGSQSSFELSTGNTYPATARPWGMNFWTPQTGKMGDGWQYTYDAHKIRGFKQTHQPSPWINDYGQFSIMPVTGKLKFDEDGRASWFSHKSEISRPHYYSVYLADHDVFVELTPTERAAMLRFTFPDTESSYVVVDAFDQGASVRIIPSENRIVGVSTRNSGGVPDNFANYFVIDFDKPFEYVSTFGKLSEADTLALRDSVLFSGFHAGAVVGFKTKRGEKVHARVASSFISPEQAVRNLNELGSEGFDSLVMQGRDSWNNLLGRVDVEDNDIDRLRTFYSCLYRSMLFPRKFYEIGADGKPLHYSPYNGETLPGYMYTDTGVWDTFRSLFPLVNLLYPSVGLEMQEGFLNAYRESGFFPEWCSPGHRDCMVGNNSASVLADAWLSGIRVSDPQTLWEGVVHGANAAHPTVKSTGRIGYEYYNKLGYVPCDVGINENAARTLEYAYDDWCIYQLGKALGKTENELKPYAERAKNYRNLFDAESSLMRGRNADGSFASPFSPLKWGDAFTEGNAWHYTWSVFHDPKGLMKLMGGRERFVAMLDSVFSVPPLFDDSYYGFPIHEIREMTVMNMGNYAHGNQPIQHMIYLYDWAGEPWKTQYWVREVMDRMYTPTPDGYCGDEDNGQTSAWYVFSALGFYPVAPGSGQYAIGSPLFRKVKVSLENGRVITLDAGDNSVSSPYIGSIMVNGNPHDANYFTYPMLLSGPYIRFQMQDVPSMLRGTGAKDVPYSYSD
jgi:putative alpha-1,2-mannosidase